MQGKLSTAQKRAQVRSMLERSLDDHEKYIAEDVASCDGLRYANPDSTQKVRHLILTGATGFLGVYILRSLLQRDGLRITCLVRATDDQNARDRIVKALHEIGAHALPTDHLDVIAHDISHPPEETSGLMSAALQADVIINSAARVNFTDRYSHARAANADGVRHLLKLARRGIRLHHVSTPAVFAPSVFAGQIISEVSTPQIAQFESAHGYCQSKLAAELMIRAAAEAGLSAMVYRPGMIGWDTETGHYNKADFLTQFISASLRVGALPDITIGLSVAPVNYVAETIVSCVFREAGALKQLHLFGESMSIGMLSSYLRQAGAQVELVDYGTWLERIDSDAGGPLGPLSLLLPARFEENHENRPPSLLRSLANDTGTVVSDALTRKHLINAGITPPKNSTLNFKTFLRKLFA